MPNQSIVVVDADPRSLRVLEVSLSKAGYDVTTSSSGQGALDLARELRPDLILTDTRLPDFDGFELAKRLRADADLLGVGLVFLSSDGSIESKIRGLELGVEDYLTKPIYIREVIARVGIELERLKSAGRRRLSQVGGNARFSGSLSEMNVIDLFQTIEVSRKSGVLYVLAPHSKHGAAYFLDGGLVHAETAHQRGEKAVYELLRWEEGNFDLEFRPVRSVDCTITTPMQAVLLEGIRRKDEWTKLSEQLPEFETRFEVDQSRMQKAQAGLAATELLVAEHLDGYRSIAQILHIVEQDEIETLRALVALYQRGLVTINEKAIPLASRISALGELQGQSAIAVGADAGFQASALRAPAPISGSSGRIKRSTDESGPLSGLHRLRAPELSEEEKALFATTEGGVAAAEDQEATDEDAIELNPEDLIEVQTLSHVEFWDDSLEALRFDPEVESAIAVLEKDPPPGVLQRSQAPADAVEAAILRGERARETEQPLELELPPLEPLRHSTVRSTAQNRAKSRRRAWLAWLGLG